MQIPNSLIQTGFKSSGYQNAPQYFTIGDNSAASAVDTQQPVESSSNVRFNIQPPSQVYGEPKTLTGYSLSSPSEADEGTDYLLDNMSKGTSTGGVLRLSELLARGDRHYQQDLRTYTAHSFPNSHGEYAPLEFTDFLDSDNKDLRGLQLQLKTKDGDVINFSIRMYAGFGNLADGRTASFNGLAIEFDFEGNLSYEEQAQINEAIKKIEAIFQGSANSMESGLASFDFTAFSTLSDVDILLSGEKTEDISFKYHDDESERSIEFSSTEETKIKIDKTSLGMHMSDEQKDMAIQAYVDLMEAATKEGNGGNLALMQSIFEMGFNNLKHKDEEDNEQAPITDNAPITISKQVSQLLVGLPDFNFSYNSTIDSPNKSGPPREYTEFKLNLSLHTRVNENTKQNTSQITQIQKFDLKAAFYSPVDSMENPDFDTQTYKYTQLERSSEKVTQILSQDGALVKALSTEIGEFKSTIQEYERGKLVDEQHKSTEYVEVKDLTELAEQKNTEQSQEILKAVIIDPYQKYKDEQEDQEEDEAMPWAVIPRAYK